MSVIATTDLDSTYATKGGTQARLGCYDGGWALKRNQSFRRSRSNKVQIDPAYDSMAKTILEDQAVDYSKEFFVELAFTDAEGRRAGSFEEE